MQLWLIESAHEILIKKKSNHKNHHFTREKAQKDRADTDYILNFLALNRKPTEEQAGPPMWVSFCYNTKMVIQITSIQNTGSESKKLLLRYKLRHHEKKSLVNIKVIFHHK